MRRTVAFAQSAERVPVGVGFTASTLGLGGDVAVGVTPWSNLRAGFSGFGYSRSFDRDGILYRGNLRLRSAEALWDIFPRAGAFHISPGVMFYDGNQVTARANVAAGQSFTLGGTTYRSSTTDPVGGSGKLNANRAAPMITAGWGNLASRTKHFTVQFDAGAAFHGSPRTALTLTGAACDPSGAFCRSVNDRTIQSSLAAEIAKLNKSAGGYKVYPVMSLGFGYRF